MAWVATAVVGGSILSGVIGANAQESAANTAADAQTQAAQASIDEQRRQFDALQNLLAPYINAGTGALKSQQDLLGMNGASAQNAYIQQLATSPQMQALTQQGENSILQNAAATGGLRGGNTQAALAQFRPAMLSQLIESQYNKLNNMTLQGQSSATGVGAAGQSMGANIGNSLMSAGDATAQAALASGQANANMWSNIGGSLGTLAGIVGKF